MIDRVQFALSVDTGSIDYESAMLGYFDQLMGIYGIIQPCNYTVAITDATTEYLVLDIKFNDGESALRSANILNSIADNKVIIYQRMFYIDNIVSVSLDTMRIRMKTI